MKLESLAEAASIGDQLARLQQKRRIVQRVLRENGDRAFVYSDFAETCINSAPVPVPAVDAEAALTLLIERHEARLAALGVEIREGAKL
jgi:hypothetical protein